MTLIDFFVNLFGDLVTFFNSFVIWNGVTFLQAVVVFGVSGMLINTFVSRGSHA